MRMGRVATDVGIGLAVDGALHLLYAAVACTAYSRLSRDL